MNDNKILVVEDDAGLREALIDTLQLAGIDCIEADSAEQAIMLLKKEKVSLVVSDVQMGGLSGIDLLKSIKLNQPELPVLMMTAYATIDDAVEAMRLGAIDYMAKPFAPQVLLNMVSRYLPEKEKETDGPIVADKQSLALLELAQKVAKSQASVMVLGPSGSGKEVLARYIHDHSDRAESPFIAINCAAIPENMLEATLFGYEKGAFTGAIAACPGKFEQAQKGTILLDEITEMDLSLQVKLLRVLQEREVERLGSRKTIKLDVRVLATSNRDLQIAVAEGKFREDLYYRLNVFPLQWLPLKDRPDDILPLAEHLIARHCEREGQIKPNLTDAAKNKLYQHSWPGNVRELDNVIQRALILQSSDVIDENEVFLELIQPTIIESQIVKEVVQEVTITTSQNVAPAASESSFKEELKDQENKIILETLESCHGRRKDVAEKLGISPRTLRYKLAKMRDLGIQVPA